MGGGRKGLPGHHFRDVTQDSEKVRLIVRDFGLGFDPLAQSGGIGLVGMHAEAILGDVTPDKMSAYEWIDQGRPRER